jgi:lipid II:glycine glycyltransferase (peptidoglycan interpeptide bridge formation enzyme)
MPEITPSAWEEFLSAYPNAHILQTTAWGELKSQYGWKVYRLLTDESGAQILLRKLPFGFSMAYIPRGPVGSNWGALWDEIDTLCKQNKAIFLKVEPDLFEGKSGDSDLAQPPARFLQSVHSIQPCRTLIVDIGGSEVDILEKMKQKTRYNIRLAQKKGIVVRSTADVETFYQMIQITSRRDRFGVHAPEYYRQVYELFAPRGQCELLLSEFEGQPIASLMVFARGERAWYFYGASSDQYREFMPTYLLQWEAIRWARHRGCKIYDLWGVPDYDEPFLEDNFSMRSDGLWGVYRFKRGFGGELKRTIGPWDRVYNSLLYTMYLKWNKFTTSAG